jgi:2-polyprenyl-6-methoxyphenol hydroxylase-like FAD-dependent oxidoreductase
MQDIIVVGARCGGAPTAMLLARKGYSVLLVDRARFPSDIPHGHFIHKHGPRRLCAWGLLDRVLATGSAMPAAIRTPIWRWASAMPSATPNSSSTASTTG